MTMTMSESSEKVQTVLEGLTEKQADQPEALRFSAEATGKPFEIAVLALQNLTLFPETLVPLGVGRPRSMRAVEAALATEEKLLACITVRPNSTGGEDAGSKELYEVGTLVMIKRMERIADAMHIVAQGTERIRVVEWKQEDPFLRAVVQILPEPRIVDPEQVEAAKRRFETSQKNINEVMFEVGYTDTKAFRDVFKKITGLTPIEYRNKYNKQQ